MYGNRMSMRQCMSATCAARCSSHKPIERVATSGALRIELHSTLRMMVMPGSSRPRWLAIRLTSCCAEPGSSFACDCHVGVSL